MEGDSEVGNPPLYRMGKERFSGMGKLCPGLRRGATADRPGSLPSASDRLFLSGLRASRARLRFNGWSPF